MANPYSSLPIPEPSAAMPVAPVPVIDSRYCIPHQVDLTIVKKVITVRDSSFTVTDVNDNVVFMVKSKVVSLRDRLVLNNAAGNTMVTLRRKVRSMHNRWQAFSGESVDPKDLIFSVKRSLIIQPKAKLNVFLATNTKEEVCDYMLKGSLLERSAKVYAGESKALVAQMKKRHTAKSILLGKDTYTITVFPNIDQAFILALVVILHELNEEEDDGAIDVV